jgi:hypothetical protein
MSSPVAALSLESMRAIQFVGGKLDGPDEPGHDEEVKQD